MGWSDTKLASLARGAHLHDIGKLGIPDSILLKPGPLTTDERTLMQRHVQIGFDLVKDIAFLSDASEIVLTHHGCPARYSTRSATMGSTREARRAGT
jgi:cyclic di-GMP phosphodiesterase